MGFHPQKKVLPMPIILSSYASQAAFFGLGHTSIVIYYCELIIELIINVGIV